MIRKPIVQKVRFGIISFRNERRSKWARKSEFLLKIIIGLALFGMVLPLQSPQAWAQIEIKDDVPVETAPQEVEVGEGAAQKYFKTRKSGKSSADRAVNPSVNYDRGPSSSGDHFLALMVGTFFNDQSYSWGSRGQDDVGNFNAGVTYRIGEWVNSMDLLFRMEYQAFKLDEGRASKLSLLPLVTFPDVNSGFPLYFGGGAGLGVFLTQIRGESHLSFDYQILAGGRLMDLSEGFGLTAELGIKNHVLLMSDGQFNSVFFSVGAIFQF